MPALELVDIKVTDHYVLILFTALAVVVGDGELC